VFAGGNAKAPGTCGGEPVRRPPRRYSPYADIKGQECKRSCISHPTRLGWAHGKAAPNQHGHSGIVVLVGAVVEIPVTPSNDSSPDVSMKAMSCSSS